MTEFFQNLPDLLGSERLIPLLRSLTILIVGYFILRLMKKSVLKLTSTHLNRQQVMLMWKVVSSLFTLLLFSLILNELGFSLSILLGAAGVLTVALGFASQTAVSNLISGLFLIGERPFVVGDVLEIDGVTGEILSIDLLSIKLRTFDNLLVRIPNEVVLKSKSTNNTRFPIRRLDTIIQVAFKENIEHVREVLQEVANKNVLCLDEPKPLFIFKGFRDSGIDLQYSIWSKRENHLDLRNSFYMEVKKAFEREGIEIPFPQLSLHVNQQTPTFKQTSKVKNETSQ